MIIFCLDGAPEDWYLMSPGFPMHHKCKMFYRISSTAPNSPTFQMMYRSTGPPRPSSPPKKAPHRKQWNVILLFGCEWLRRLPLCLNGNSTDFRSIGMENSPSPEKNVRKGIEKVALLAGFQTHAWHLWSFWCTFIGSFSDSEWKKREELSAGKSFFGVIASAKEISQDLPWVTTGRSINSLKLGKDGSTHPTIFWGESL